METTATRTTRRTRTTPRKPLSDCTNTLTSVNSPSKSSSSASRSTKFFSSLPKPTQSISSIIPKLVNQNHTHKESTSKPENPPNNHSTDDNHRNLSHIGSLAVLPPATPTPSCPSSSVDTTRDETSEPCSVYSRRQPAEKRKSKGKAAVAPMSCLPSAKTQSKRDKINQGIDDSLSKSLTEPCKKKRCNAPPGKAIPMHAMTKDFIEQQRAYFAEIDAFELPEEEVDAVDESD